MALGPVPTQAVWARSHEAWMSGIIPNHTGAMANAYFATANERKAEYLAAVSKHGHAAVNTGRVAIRSQLSSDGPTHAHGNH